MATKNITKSVENITHDEAKRKNIPSVEQQSIATQEHIAPRQWSITGLAVPHARAVGVGGTTGAMQHARSHNPVQLRMCVLVRQLSTHHAIKVLGASGLVLRGKDQQNVCVWDRVHQYVDFRAAYCPKYVKVRTSTRIGGVRGFSTCLCLAVKRTALSLTC